MFFPLTVWVEKIDWEVHLPSRCLFLGALEVVQDLKLASADYFFFLQSKLLSSFCSSLQMCTWYKASGPTKWQGDFSAVKAKVVLTGAPRYPKGWWRWPQSCKELQLLGLQEAPCGSSGWPGCCCCIAAPARRGRCAQRPPPSLALVPRAVVACWHWWCASQHGAHAGSSGDARIACEFTVTHKPRPLCSSL